MSVPNPNACASSKEDICMIKYSICARRQEISNCLWRFSVLSLLSGKSTVSKYISYSYPQSSQNIATWVDHTVWFHSEIPQQRLHLNTSLISPPKIQDPSMFQLHLSPEPGSLWSGPILFSERERERELVHGPFFQHKYIPFFKSILLASACILSPHVAPDLHGNLCTRFFFCVASALRIQESGQDMGLQVGRFVCSWHCCCG